MKTCISLVILIFSVASFADSQYTACENCAIDRKLTLTNYLHYGSVVNPEVYGRKLGSQYLCSVLYKVQYGQSPLRNAITGMKPGAGGYYVWTLGSTGHDDQESSVSIAYEFPVALKKTKIKILQGDLANPSFVERECIIED